MAIANYLYLSAILFTIGAIGVVVRRNSIVVFMCIEWFGRKNDYALATFGLSWPKAFRWSFYMVLLIAIFILGTKEQEFIYFQF